MGAIGIGIKGKVIKFTATGNWGATPDTNPDSTLWNSGSMLQASILKWAPVTNLDTDIYLEER